MTKYYALALTTSYWKPGDNYTDKIINALDGKIENGDFVVVSEKAISTARGNIIDESTSKAKLKRKGYCAFLDANCLGIPPWDFMPFWTAIVAQVKAVPAGVWQPPQTSSSAVCGIFAGADVWF